MQWIFIFVLIARTNFSRNFVRVLCATVRDFSPMTMQFKSRKRIENKSVIPGFECSATKTPITELQRDWTLRPNPRRSRPRVADVRYRKNNFETDSCI